MKIFGLIIFLFIITSHPYRENIYNQNIPKVWPTQVAEKVYLHTDRVYYNPGDDIWFKAYVIDALTSIPAPYTSNLHVELISPASIILKSSVIRIENGVGNGSFTLSGSVSSGRYRIRAYTNNMRNYDDHFFFNKELVVINPGDGGNKLKDSMEYIKNKLDVSFFPEGGSLVDNILSVVAFKSVNAIGKGCEVTGELFSSDGKMITTFKSNYLGMGFFNLKPVAGLSYYAAIKSINGEETVINIPKSFPTGVAMHLIVRNNKLLLTINTNGETLPSIMNKLMKVTLSSRNLFTKSTTIKTNSLFTSFTIPLNDFPEGILRVTLTDTDGTPLCERLIYSQKSKDTYIEVTSDKQQYKPREEVKINLTLTGDTTFSKKAFLSFSAAESSMTADPALYVSSISSWFLLESDVRGLIECPSYYFDTTNKNRLSDLDLLLLTQGWRDFQWKYDQSNSFKHEMGFPISGRVRRILVNKPIPGAKVNIGIFSDKPPSFIIAQQDSSGHFSTGGIDITGRARVIASISGKKEKLEGWLLLDTLIYKPAKIESIPSETKSLLPGNYTELKNEAIVRNTIKKKYKLSDTINLSEVVIEGKKKDSPQASNIKMSRSSYGTPDRELIITPELEKKYSNIFLIAAKIPGVIFDGTGFTIRGEPPAMMLDGVGIEPDFVSSLPLSMIDRIDVLNFSAGTSMFGTSAINFITKVGYTGNKQALHSASINIPGYDAPRLFYSPKYNNRDTSAFMSDTRSTIFWEPNITTGDDNIAKLNFFNADKSTTVEVIVEGITSEGIPVTGKTRYEVK